MKRKKWEKFLLIREEIKKQRESPEGLRSYEIGKRREQRMADILQEMEKSELIRGFAPSGNLSFQDVMEGIDFFVVYVDGKIHRFLPLSVTGERWIEKHRKQHPEIPIIDIAESDTAASVKSKIMEAIKNKGS